MGKLSLMIWIMAAPTLMGSFITFVLISTSFADELALWIPVAALTGATLAVPISYLIARKIKNNTGKT